MSGQIFAEVSRVWTDLIGLPESMTESEKQEFLQERTAEISAQIELSMGTAQGPLVASFKSEHGREPDFPTKLALIETARAQITAQVLQEMLYEQIPEALDPFPEEADSGNVPEKSAEQNRNDPQRWRKALVRSEPRKEIEELTDQLFPTRSTLYRVMAAYLMQTLSEDGRQIPTSSSDPLLPSFISQLEAAMVEDGQPLDGPGALVERK